MTQQVQRRELSFDELDAVMRDVDALAADGYDQAGNWDLGQACGHLADSMRYPLDGFPKPPLPIRVMLWAMKVTVGRRQLKKVLATGAMPSGGPTLRETVPPPGGDDAAAAEGLRQVVQRFQTHQGPFHPSTLFGSGLGNAHATAIDPLAHHLSFLVKR